MRHGSISRKRFASIASPVDFVMPLAMHFFCLHFGLIWVELKSNCWNAIHNITSNNCYCKVTANIKKKPTNWINYLFSSGFIWILRWQKTIGRVSKISIRFSWSGPSLCYRWFVKGPNRLKIIKIIVTLNTHECFDSTLNYHAAKKQWILPITQNFVIFHG